MAHTKITEVISKLKGTLYVPTKQLAESEKKLAPSKLMPGVHFLVKELSATYKEELTDKFDKFLMNGKLKSSIFPKLMGMEAQMLQRHHFLNRAIHNEVSVRYAIVDPLIDCLAAVFDLKVELEYTAELEFSIPDTDIEFEGETEGRAVAKSISDKSRIDYTLFTLKSESISCVLIEVKFNEITENSICQAIAYHIIAEHDPSLEPFVIVICENSFDFILFPYSSIDAVRLGPIDLFSKTEDVYGGPSISLHMPGILIIFEFINVLTGSERFRISLQNRPPNLSNYQKGNLRAIIMNIKQESSIELEERIQELQEQNKQNEKDMKKLHKENESQRKRIIDLEQLVDKQKRKK